MFPYSLVRYPLCKVGELDICYCHVVVVHACYSLVEQSVATCFAVILVHYQYRSLKRKDDLLERRKNKQRSALFDVPIF
jgi:hypothetical protein